MIVKLHLSDIHGILVNPGSCYSRRVQQERADSPGPSCVSMKSDRSMDYPHDFRDGNQSIEKR